MKDNIINGAVAGLVSGSVVAISTQVPHYFNINKECFIVAGGKLISSAPMWSLEFLIYSNLVHLLFSMTYSVILAFLLFYSGKKYYLLKGLIYGGFLWLFNLAFLAPRLGILDKNKMDLPTLFITFGNHLLFGILAAFLIIKLGLPEKREVL